MEKETPRWMAEEIFDAMLHGAIEDLNKSGLNRDAVFSIIKQNFGLRYAQKFCREKTDRL